MADWITIVGTAATSLLGGGGVTALWIKSKTSRQERFEESIMTQLTEFKEENKALQGQVQKALTDSARADTRTEVISNMFFQILPRYQRVREDYRKLLKQTNPNAILEVDEFERMEMPERSDFFNDFFNRGDDQ